MLKAHSRNNAGTVTLRSADPQDMPAIDFNYFDTGVTDGGADEKDLQAVYEAMQFSRQIFEDLVPLQSDFEEVWPGPNVTTEEGMKDFIKQEAWGHHAVSLACCGDVVDKTDQELSAALRRLARMATRRPCWTRSSVSGVWMG